MTNRRVAADEASKLLNCGDALHGVAGDELLRRPTAASDTLREWGYAPHAGAKRRRRRHAHSQPHCAPLVVHASFTFFAVSVTKSAPSCSVNSDPKGYRFKTD
jgi:hypothetical protein